MHLLGTVLSKELGVAVGNILGGIAIQTVVLAVLDVFGVRKSEPLTYLAASISLVLEGLVGAFQEMPPGAPRVDYVGVNMGEGGVYPLIRL